MGTLYTRLSSITGEMSPESIEHHIARVMLEHIHQLNNISIGTILIYALFQNLRSLSLLSN